MYHFKPSSDSSSQSQTSNKHKIPGFDDYSDMNREEEEEESSFAVAESHYPSSTSNSSFSTSASSSTSSSTSSSISSSTSSTSKNDSDSSSDFNQIMKSPSKSRGSLSPSSLLKLSRSTSQDRLTGPTVQFRSKQFSIPKIVISDYSSSSSSSSSTSSITVDLSLLDLEPHTLPFKESSRLTPKCPLNSNPFIQQYDNGLLSPPTKDIRGKIMVKTHRPILKKVTAQIKPSKASTSLSSLDKKSPQDSNIYVPWTKLTLPRLSRNDEKIEETLRDRVDRSGTMVTISDYDYDENFEIKEEENSNLEQEWSKRESNEMKEDQKSYPKSRKSSLSFKIPDSHPTKDGSTSTSNQIKRRSLPPPLSLRTDLERKSESKKFVFADDDDDDDDDEDEECQTPPDSRPTSPTESCFKGSSPFSSQTKIKINETSKTSFLKHSFIFSELPSRLSNVPGRLRTDGGGTWIMD